MEYSCDGDQFFLIWQLFPSKMMMRPSNTLVKALDGDVRKGQLWADSQALIGSVYGKCCG
jgi:hypothetical protein